MERSANWLQWVYWKETPSVYGPVWVALAGLIEWISRALDGDIVNAVLGNKLLADISHLANIVLVWKIAGLVIPKFWTKPKALPGGVSAADWATGAQVAVTLLYAWYPLVLLEFGANGHNDIIMVTGILAAIWLHLKGRWQLAVVTLGLASLIKLIALLFVPGYFWLLFWQAAPGSFTNGFWQRIQFSRRPAATGRNPSYSLYPLLGWPRDNQAIGYRPSYVPLCKLDRRPDQVEGATASIGYGREMNLKPDDFWTVSAIGDRIDHFVRLGLTLIVAVVALIMTWRARTFPTMVVAWGWILFAYLTVGAVWFWPWYVVWLLPLAAFAGPARLLKGTLILSGTSMLLYATLWISSRTIAEIETWKSVVMEVPPLVYVLTSWWLERRRARATVPAPTPVPVPAGRQRELPEAVRVPVAPAVPARCRKWLATVRPLNTSTFRTAGARSESLLSPDQLDY